MRNVGAVQSVMAVPILFYGAVFLAPLAVLLLESIEATAIAELAADPFLLHVVRFTYVQALLSAALSVLVGGAGAVMWSETRFRGRDFLWRTSLTAFALPSLLVALALVGVWGRSGIATRFLGMLGLDVGGVGFYGWPAILCANVFFNFPLALKIIGTALAERDRLPEQAALSLGAGRWRCFLSVTLPSLAPEIAGAFWLTFLYSSAASFVIVLALGGGPRFTTLEVAIYQAVKVDFDLARAAVLAALQLVVAWLVHGLFLLFARRRARLDHGRFVPTFFPSTGPLRRASLVAYGTVFAVLVGLPLASLVGQGLAAIPRAGTEDLGQALLNSVVLAVAAACLSVTTALALAYCHRHATHPVAKAALAAAAGVPLAVSTLVLLLALRLAYPSIFETLSGSLVPIAVVQAVVALPAAFRPLRDGLDRIPDDYYRAARSLGAGELATLARVELPLLGRSLLAAATIAAAFSLGEVGAVLLFASDEITTLPLLVFRLMGQYRFDEAHAVALVLLCLVVSALVVVERKSS